MKKLEHFIVTLINVNLYRKRDKEHHYFVKNKDEWLDTRLELFKKYTIPSIANQGFANFTWLWLVDRDTPKAHRDKIEALRNERGNIKYVSNICHDYKETIKNANAKNILTTTLDSDDILAHDFAEKVQKEAYGNLTQVPFAINFPIGLYYDIRNKEGCQLYKKIVNQFVSIVEPIDKIKGIYSAPHNEIDKYFRTIWVPTERPMWVWLRHNSQVTKRPNENFRPIDKKELKRFGI